MGKPINKSLRGIRDSIPGGYILGRTGSGKGPPILLPLNTFTTPGYVANTTIQVNGPAGGDLSGTYPNPTVAKIQGNAVKTGVPSDKQVLTWVNGNSDWEPATPHYLIAGGSTGQVLEKNSGTDYDVSWQTPSSSSGAPGSCKDDGTNVYFAMIDSNGQLVLDSHGNPIFGVEVFPNNAIPAPGANGLGGVKSFAAVPHEWINAVSNAGVHSASQPASADISDITSGTWTPTIIGTTGNPIATYNGQSGFYFQIGKMTFFSLFISTSAFSGGSGNLAFSLPFTVGSLASADDTCFAVANNGINLGTGLTQAVGICIAGQSYIELFGNENNASQAAVPVSGWGAANNIRISGFFRAA